MSDLSEYLDKIEAAARTALEIALREHDHSFHFAFSEDVRYDGNWIVAENHSGRWRVEVRISDGEVRRFARDEASWVAQ